MDRAERLEGFKKYVDEVKGGPVDSWVVFSDMDRTDNQIQLWKDTDELVSFQVASRMWEESELPPLSDEEVAELSARGFSGDGRQETITKEIPVSHLDEAAGLLEEVFTTILKSPDNFELMVETDETADRECEWRASEEGESCERPS